MRRRSIPTARPLDFAMLLKRRMRFPLLGEIIGVAMRAEEYHALLAAANQDTDEKDADAADDHLECRAQKRRVHITVPNPAD